MEPCTRPKPRPKRKRCISPHPPAPSPNLGRRGKTMATGKPQRTPPGIKKQARELRREMTLAEIALWAKLRNRQLDGYKFRRQSAIGPFIADFYCAECRLVVEIDGDIHDLRHEEDLARTHQFEEHGYHVIRFRNQEVLQNIRAVLAAILQTCQELRSNESLLPELGEGAGDEGITPDRMQSDPSGQA